MEKQQLIEFLEDLQKGRGMMDVKVVNGNRLFVTSKELNDVLLKVIDGKFIYHPVFKISPPEFKAEVLEFTVRYLLNGGE